jgi:hypothetical protein
LGRAVDRATLRLYGSQNLVADLNFKVRMFTSSFLSPTDLRSLSLSRADPVLPLRRVKTAAQLRFHLEV